MASNNRTALANDRGWRAYVLDSSSQEQPLAEQAKAASGLGFNVLLARLATPEDPAAGRPEIQGQLTALLEAAGAHGLTPLVDVIFDGLDAPPASAAQAFRRQPAVSLGVMDPRKPIIPVEGLWRLHRPRHPALAAWWRNELDRLHRLGLAGVVNLDDNPRALALATVLREDGAHIKQLLQGRSDSSNQAAARFIDAGRMDASALRAELAAAILAGDWAIAGLGDSAETTEIVRGANRLQASFTDGFVAPVRDLTGSGASVAISSRQTPSSVVISMRNKGPLALQLPFQTPPGAPWTRLKSVPGFEVSAVGLARGQTALFIGSAPPAVVRSVAQTAEETAEEAADPTARVIISGFSPSVDQGAYAAKTTVGDTVAVTADIFADGHEKLAAAILSRALDETDWVRQPLTAQPNDVWTGEIRFQRLGGHEIKLQAWVDRWGGFTRDFTKKRDADKNLVLDIEEGRLLLRRARPHAPGGAEAVIAGALAALDAAEADQASVLLDQTLAAAMAEADEQPFLTESFVQPIEVEREAARYSSWYEVFPRSQTNDPSRHGTFLDVINRLPHIATMGFDTLYFPPIHPIGTTNRKGRNNSLTAQPGEVGSPYAIGAAEGGHTAIHPELGSLEDFRALVAAAKAHGVEIALDFAIQCSPDHPWLKEHPGWFDWRPDGSLKYAENPPKTYEDIVNVDFYASCSVPSLWKALLDAVLFWADQGVKAFRVDNPHTKPLPFWRWMIAEVKRIHPDAIFLSEAFTRPKPMYHLAKVGFSQSYSYFTWRHTKAEFQDYLTELTQTPVRDFFRPHFFVNTPDIDPYFLQTSGRPGFLIRAALAATLSGLFGVYAGFELCEAAALPGREEYLNSEKYEVRPRPDRARGDIVDEITALNQIRRREPALQSHLNVAFHNAFNDQVLYFSKTTPGRSDRILVAINLDPHSAQETDIEVPLWLHGLTDWDAIAVEDLLGGGRFRWTGKIQHIRLGPERPYAIWRIGGEY